MGLQETEPVRVRVSCSACDFERVVPRGEAPMPTDVIVSHGRETGHTLTVTTLDASDR